MLMLRFEGVTSFQSVRVARSHHSRGHGQSSESSTSTSTILSAKPKKPNNISRQQGVPVPVPASLLSTTTGSTTGTSNSDDEDDSSVVAAANTERIMIPANLRRKVQAKRPTLGHVVSAVNGRRMGAAAAASAVSTGGSAPTKLLRPQGKHSFFSATPTTTTNTGNSNNNTPYNNPSLLKIAAGTARGRRLDSPTVYLRPMMGKVKEAVYSTFTSFGLYDNNDNNASFCLRHLDIFAGSGSVGLESLSRGADHCTFVDFSADCCACIQRNLDLTGLGGTGTTTGTTTTTGNDRGGGGGAAQQQKQQQRSLVCCADALTALRDPAAVGIPLGSPYQIVTLCPPYEEVVYGDLLEAVVGSSLVTDDTVILVEYPVELGCLPHVVTVATTTAGSGENHDNDDNGRSRNTAVGVRNRRYGRTVIAMYVINPTGKLSDAANSRPEEFVQV